jgi:hypothetical protein
MLALRIRGAWAVVALPHSLTHSLTLSLLADLFGPLSALLKTDCTALTSHLIHCSVQTLLSLVLLFIYLLEI